MWTLTLQYLFLINNYHIYIKLKFDRLEILGNYKVRSFNMILEFGMIESHEFENVTIQLNRINLIRFGTKRFLRF